MTLRIEVPFYPRNLFERLENYVPTWKRDHFLQILFKFQKKLWLITHRKSLLALWDIAEISNTIASNSFSNKWAFLSEKNQGSLLAILYSSQCLTSSIRSIEDFRPTSSSVILRTVIEQALWGKALLELDDLFPSKDLKGSNSANFIKNTHKDIPGCKKLIKELSKYLQHSKFHSYVFKLKNLDYKMNVSRDIIPADDLVICDLQFTLSLILKTSSIYILILENIIANHSLLNEQDQSKFSARLKELKTKIDNFQEEEKQKAILWLNKYRGMHVSEID